MAALHAPKRETFDVAAMTNVDPKGFVRQVDQYRRTDFGLYMARPSDHPEFWYLQSWLLPALGLRASIFHFTAGHDKGWRHYLDVADIREVDGVWHTEDWYLDLLDRPGRPLELVDVDELFAAHEAGYLGTDACVRAVDIATRAIAGAAAHGDVMNWLAGAGAPLTWVDPSGRGDRR
jgi:predicted RNA-binding protein associated with RNAse of E/G family